MAWTSLFPTALNRERPERPLLDMFPGVVFAGGLTEIHISWKATPEAQKQIDGLDGFRVVLEYQMGGRESRKTAHEVRVFEKGREEDPILVLEKGQWDALAKLDGVVLDGGDWK